MGIIVATALTIFATVYLVTVIEPRDETASRQTAFFERHRFARATLGLHG